LNFEDFITNTDSLHCPLENCHIYENCDDLTPFESSFSNIWLNEDDIASLGHGSYGTDMDDYQNLDSAGLDALV
jgi:hypothetical protein